MKSVDVFIRFDAEQNAAAVHLLRQWHLNQDAVDLGTLIQPLDNAEEFSSRDVFRWRDFLAVNSEFAAGFDFAANVNLRGRIVPHQNHRQAWRPRARGNFRDARPQLGKNLLADPLAIQDFCAHSFVSIAEEREATAGQCSALLRRAIDGFAGLFRGGTSFVSQQLLSELANMLVLQIVVEKFLVLARILRPNHALTVDENHQRNQRALVGRPLEIFQRSFPARGAYGERRLEALDEPRQVRVLVHRCLYYRKAFRTEVLLNATQDLSGFLAVRSGGQNEDQAQYLAPVLAHQQLLVLAYIDDELGRFARNLDCEQGCRYQCQDQYRSIHE